MQTAKVSPEKNTAGLTSDGNSNTLISFFEPAELLTDIKPSSQRAASSFQNPVAFSEGREEKCACHSLPDSFYCTPEATGSRQSEMV
jgi:hypothetical protein